MSNIIYKEEIRPEDVEFFIRIARSNGGFDGLTMVVDAETLRACFRAGQEDKETNETE